MANYLSLEEAAEKLGIPTDRLVELRSQGEVRGFRDGASWKFPENEIDRLADELGDAISGGSGVLVSDSDVGSGVSQGDSNVIGGDTPAPEDGSSSDLGIGAEPLKTGSSGSDVNLIASEGEGSDVAIVASDSDLMMESAGSGLVEMDSGDLQLEDAALLHDSAQLDLAVEPNAGSTGPVTDEELREIAESHPDIVAPEADSSSAEGSGIGTSAEGSGIGTGSSELDLGNEDEDVPLQPGSDLSFSGLGAEDDSGEELIGADDSSGMGVLGSGIEPADDAQTTPSRASSLELMGDLDQPSELDVSSMGSRGADVLSELDLLGSEQHDSGLISGDSQQLLGSSGLGSGLDASDSGGLDDALADDDELVIADDDDDLVISSAGSDISVAGDSGINLMSPSDSGLSLESEPLDLAGSSISALDLGAELSEGGSGSGSGSGGGSDEGSAVDFQADEEFQLSPSGVGLDADIDSGSQVIEIEDSEAIGEPVEFAGEGFVEAEPLGGDVFGAEPGAEEVLAVEEEGDAIAIDETAAAVAPAAIGGYEVPFTMLQCVTLMLILCVLSLGGMLMTDLVRNMWTYSEPAAPVSSLTDSLIGLMGWGQ
jgi:excisionase family DNA binding protein